jgi:asparagine synthase (glutamine-hydrolysing)
MCGIAGKLYFDAARPVERPVLEAMNRVLAHRGPDDEGLFADGPIGLAHRRLSIVDLSPAGHQPMASPGGALWITFNGEIYNFPELRKELESRGVVFRSHTDTEVLLALWELDGPACLERLSGMFAFGLWDSRRRTLVLARDRVGKKPLYYYVDDRKALFASEPKGIYADPDVPARANLDAIDAYLTYGYVPAPESAFRGLARVPPGHYVEIGASGRVTTTRYWRLAFRPKLEVTEERACEMLEDHLREAVRRRLIADVPLGAFLSGGIDSSLVVALMSELTDRPVKTFSIGFEDEAYNELSWARMVASRYHTEHHEFVVKPDAIAVLPQIVWHYNEPYADSSAIATYYLSELARRHVTVALSGDAGDENFAGYERYRLHLVTTRLDLLSRVGKRAIGVAVRALPATPWTSRSGRLRRYWLDAMTESRRRYGRWMTILPEGVKAELYSPWFREATAGGDPMDVLLSAYALADTPDLLDAMLGADILTYLPDDLLVKMDIACMAHGLETRSPMVDHALVEFAARLPSDLKLRHGVKKYLLKRVAQSRIPASILDRPKQGFGVPIAEWLRGPLRDLLHDTLFGQAARERGLFEPHMLRRLIHEHDHNIGERHPQLWALLMLELWFARFIDRPRPALAA